MTSLSVLQRDKIFKKNKQVNMCIHLALIIGAFHAEISFLKSEFVMQQQTKVNNIIAILKKIQTKM